MKNLENALDTSLNLKSIIMVFCNPFLPSSIGASFRCSVGDTNRLFSCLNKWQAGHIDRAVMWIGKSAENHIAEIGVLQATDTDKLDLVRSGIKTCFLDSLQQPFMPGLLQSLKSSIVQVDATSVAVKEVADFVFESNISFASSCFSMLNFQRYDPFPPSCSEFVACFEGKEQLTLRPTFGVICGYISSSSATLMLECSRSGYVELTCVDGLTGREHSLSKFVAGGTPAEFHFINLASFRNYDVLINKIKFSTDANTLFTSCNFTTLKRFSSMRLTGEKNILQDLRSVNVEQSIVQSIPSEAKLPQNGDNLEMDRMQILILGSVYTLPSSSKTMNFLSLPRVMCQPWNGINLIIHGPGSIDWRSAVLSAFSYISTVDRVCDTDEIVGIELKIYSIFKDAIRKSFNDDMAFHHCLRNTANYFTSSAIADLVVAMNTFNIQDVVQDTSEFAVNAIISSISKVQIEYFTKLWRYEINEDAFALSYIDETNTIMFEIKPNYSYTEGFHISSRHVSAIRSVLSRDIFKDLYTKLLLVSPFPLITGDTMSEKYSFIQSNSSFYCCDSSQSMVLLDVCYEWLKNSAKRELVLVCWSNTGVFTTSVTGELKQKNGATHDLQHNSVSVNENSVFGVGEEMISQQSPLEINHELASSHVPVFYQVCSTISSDIVESSSFSTQGKLYNMDGFYHFKFHHTFESMTENYNIVGIPWNPDAKQIAITLLKADNDYFLNYADDLEANEVIDQLSEFSSYESMMELVSNYLSEDTLKVNTSIDILHDIQLAVRNLLRVEDKTILAIFDQVKMESAELTLSLSYLMHIHHIFVKLYCRFSVSTRDILCLPSRFATFCTIQKCLAFKTPDDSSPLQKLIIQLTTSVDYFKEFAIVAFTVQLFLEQLSLKFGLLD